MAAITVIIPDELRARLNELADKNQRSVGAEIRYRVEMTLAEEQSGQAKELAEALEAAR